MKALKFFGILFICLGCMAAFVGVAAAVLPTIQNDQLQLVLTSFATPAANPVVNAMNAAMTYALHNCYGVMLLGGGGAILGVLLLLAASKGAPAARKAAHAEQRKQPVPRPAARPAQNEAVPTWRTSKAEDATARNPFAARMANDMMSYRANRTAASPAYQAEPTAPTFAPAAQRQAETPPVSDAFAPSPYARPEPPSTERPSPYARPEPVPAERFSPYARPEPILAEPPASELSVPEPPAPPQTAAPAPVREAKPPAERYQPLFAERELPAEAPPEPPITSVPPPEPPVSPQYASPAAEPPKRTLPAGWASPAQAGWLTPKEEPAPDLVTPVPPLPVRKTAQQNASPKARIKSTMGKHHK